NVEIASNRFVSDSTGISLWANPIEPSDWGYPKHRDTRSRDYLVRTNLFVDERVAVRAVATRPGRLTGNMHVRIDSMYALADSDWAIERDSPIRTATAAQDSLFRGDVGRMVVPPEFAKLAPPKLPAGFDPSRSPLARRDRSAIIVTEWGPYDWSTPLLWPADSSRAGPLRVRVLGPPRRWRRAG